MKTHPGTNIPIDRKNNEQNARHFDIQPPPGTFSNLPRAQAETGKPAQHSHGMMPRGNELIETPVSHSSLPFQALDWMILCDKVNRYGNFYVAEVSPQFLDKADSRALDEAKQNLAFIVRACNNAQRLAEALKITVRKWDIRMDVYFRANNLPRSTNEKEPDWIIKAREALSAWEGAQQ